MSLTKVTCLKQITKEFPDITYTSSQYLDHGWDDVVLILDSKFVFAFPRADKYIQEKFQKELRLMPKLAPKLPLPVPVFTHIARSGLFAGYPYIAGERLRREVIETFNSSQRRCAAQTMAVFMQAMHQFPVRTARVCGVTKTWTVAEHRAWAADRLAYIVKHLSKKQAQELQSLFDSCMHSGLHERMCLIHQDLTSEHILFDTRTKKISGIIDFGEAQIGDPLNDLARMWEYGEDFVDLVLKYYRTNDPYLKIRSFEKFIYFGISLLYFGIKKKRKDYWNRGFGFIFDSKKRKV